jgi:hypothetical protein
MKTIIKSHSRSEMQSQLNACARAFYPGKSMHAIRKSVRWGGISSVREFNIKSDAFGNDTAFICERELRRIPKSNIRNADIESAVPFKCNGVPGYSGDDDKKPSSSPALVRQGPPRRNIQNVNYLPPSSGITTIALNAIIDQLRKEGFYDNHVLATPINRRIAMCDN